MLNITTHHTIKKTLSQDQFMSFEFTKSFIKDKYGEESLLHFTEYMRKVYTEDSHLSFNEFLYIGELLARSLKQHNTNH